MNRRSLTIDAMVWLLLLLAAARAQDGAEWEGLELRQLRSRLVSAEVDNITTGAKAPTHLVFQNSGFCLSSSLSRKERLRMGSPRP